MNTYFKKIHPLWIICIFIRLLLVYLPFIRKLSNISKYIILFMGLGFLYKSIFGSNNEFQVKKVFWHKVRFVHAILFISAAFYFENKKLSSFLLFSSVIFSLIYRFFKGHFK